eukprot:TRINITY_DN1913_c0_g1_i1.p1 TRINITY_DN1913_c0_g1~~TRINITY_DN1913_c0_g1_i1.p1  ORF type:complete len:162 (+),score=26.83 TRINITY_DN1913_c0_g1_i1:186-671(+)
MITGLVCLELLKVVQNKPLEAFKNAYVNLALPLATFSEPVPPSKNVSKPAEKKKCYPEGFTEWDTIIVDIGDITLQALCDHFEKLGLNVCSIACGHKLMYQSYLPKHSERLPKKITDLYREMYKTEFRPEERYLDLAVECEDGEDYDLEIDIPLVRLKFRK